ncbi:MAG: hypothetical protein F4Z50_12760 [Gemmatimonadetes bacterium]|nr:hypothetical protein [Gemmatimonadota bacterium]MYD15389.1 hypothetical protein [Gemmatimonadota bacterium]
MTCRLLLPTVTSLLATACLSGDSASHSSIVRDSAGVRIAENPSDARGEEWRLQIPAVLEIGRSEGQGPGPDLFGSVRHAILLSTGDIAVADGLAAEVRVFNEDGGHLLTFGGRGEGPGEFVNLWTIAEVAGDSVAAVDAAGERVSLFTPAGTFARSFAIPRIPGASFPNVIGWLEEGPLLIETRTRSPSRDTRDQSTHFLYAADRHGETLSTLGEFPGVRLGGNGLGLAFGGRAVFAAGGTVAWYGHSSRFELTGYDATGSLRRVVRMHRALRPVTDTDVSVARAEVEEGLRGMTGPAVERMLATEFASTHPVHGELLAGAAGDLWVERYRSDFAEDPVPQVWDIFDADGRLTAYLEAPNGFRITDIGARSVLGVHTDPLGVEAVRLYQLQRGPGER